MERLTFHVSNDVARLICRIEKGACVGKTYTCPDTTPGCSEIQKVLNKLSAYEDTGLEPDSVEEAKEAVGRAAIELAYYHKAEQEGRLLVLPCKVGDTVYWIKGKAILEVYIQWFETNAYGWCACGTYPPMATPTFRFADFGKTVFLTREEAKATLERGVTP